MTLPWIGFISYCILIVQGGIGITRSLDVLAAKYLKYDQTESPRLVCYVYAYSCSLSYAHLVKLGKLSIKNETDCIPQNSQNIHSNMIAVRMPTFVYFLCF